MDKVYVLKNVKTSKVECVFSSLNGCLKHLEKHFNNCDRLTMAVSHNKSYKETVVCENFKQLKEVFKNHRSYYLSLYIGGITEYKYEIHCTDFIDE